VVFRHPQPGDFYLYLEGVGAGVTGQQGKQCERK